MILIIPSSKKQFGALSLRMKWIEVSKILISKEVIRILSPLSAEK